MKTHAGKTPENTLTPSQSSDHMPSSLAEADIGFSDHRRETAVQRQLQNMANSSPPTHPAPGANHTGLPTQLKSGIESLSGFAMDDVRVHYNSSKPAQLQAHAYAQGTQIHLARGQEKHLPHEAWHVVQQKQGRVKPTLSVGSAQVNDSKSLEREADSMGARAMSATSPVAQRVSAASPTPTPTPAGNIVQRAELAKDKLNVVGEEHGESDSRRDIERVFSAKATNSHNYWQEGSFVKSDGQRGDPGGLRFLQFWAFAETAGLGAHLTAGNCQLGTVKAQLGQNRGKLAMTGMLQAYFILNTEVLFRSWRAELKNCRPDEPYRDQILEIGELLKTHESAFTQAFVNSDKKIKDYYKMLHQQSNSSEEWSESSEDELSEDEFSEDESFLAEPEVPLANELDLDQLLQPLIVHANGLLAAWQKFRQIKEDHNIGDDQDVAEKRSVEMDAAANGNVDTLGVWKIGDLHRRHMDAYPDKRYNLLSRGDFNSLLTAFDKKVSSLVFATAGGIIGGVVGGPLGAFLGVVAGGLFGLVAGHYIGKKRNKIRDV